MILPAVRAAETRRRAAFPADARTARGFNGDIDRHAHRWRVELDEGGDPRRWPTGWPARHCWQLASLVSVHDETWTMDRVHAAHRWAQIRPAAALDLAVLTGWAQPGRAGLAIAGRFWA